MRNRRRRSFRITNLDFPAGWGEIRRARKKHPSGARSATLCNDVAARLKQAAEKVDSAASAPKGACDFARLTVSLKRYPDTKPSFSASCKSRALPKAARIGFVPQSETGQAPSLHDFFVASETVPFPKAGVHKPFRGAQNGAEPRHHTSSFSATCAVVPFPKTHSNRSLSAAVRASRPLAQF